MDPIELEELKLGPNERPVIVAEAGTNFRDDLDLAERLIEEAAEAGADVVKFQTHVQSAEMAESSMRDLGFGDLYDRLGTYSFSLEEHRRLQRHCENEGVVYISTPYSVEGVSMLDELDVPAIKIGSGELTNFHLLRAAVETGKPLLVSTGMADYETIARTVEFLAKRDAKLALLYCVSRYPTDANEFNFGVLEEFRKRFGVPIGFSDHSVGVEAPSIAMARGASIIEKHFTIDRRLPGGDQAVSVEPEEMARIVRFARLSHATRGSEKPVHDEEAEVAKWARHSVVSAVDIEAGVSLTEGLLTTKRPGTGIPAHRFYQILGSRTASPIQKDTVLTEDHLE